MWDALHVCEYSLRFMYASIRKEIWRKEFKSWRLSLIMTKFLIYGLKSSPEIILQHQTVYYIRERERESGKNSVKLISVRLLLSQVLTDFSVFHTRPLTNIKETIISLLIVFPKHTMSKNNVMTNKENIMIRCGEYYLWSEYCNNNFFLLARSIRTWLSKLKSYCQIYI